MNLTPEQIAALHCAGSHVGPQFNDHGLSAIGLLSVVGGWAFPTPVGILLVDLLAEKREATLRCAYWKARVDEVRSFYCGDYSSEQHEAFRLGRVVAEEALKEAGAEP